LVEFGLLVLEKIFKYFQCIFTLSLLSPFGEWLSSLCQVWLKLVLEKKNFKLPHPIFVIISPLKRLVVCFELHEQFFSYLATVTITGHRAANLDLCLALTAFSSVGSFMCHTYCDTGPPFLRSYPKDLILTSECRALGEGAITTHFKRLMRPARARLELMTSRLLGEHYH
jgi:hypothetical protein